MIYLIIGYVYLAIHRPMEIWPALEPLRIELLYFMTLCTAWLAAPKRLGFEAPVVAIPLLGAAVYASWMLSPWNTYGEIAVKNYTLVVVFAMILATNIRTEKQLNLVIVAFILVMTIYMLHSVYEYKNGRHVYRMGISRLVGVDKSLGDPNSFGASIVYALPFVRYLWMTVRAGWRRWLLVGYVLLSVGCIGLTGSRSSLVGLLAWAVLSALLFGRKKMAILLGLGLLGMASFVILPDDLQNRFYTIIDPSVGPENARTSGQGRIDGFFNGLALWARFPLTGSGPGSWKPATGSPIESHNLYGQLVGELGTLGAFAFGFMLFSLFAGIWKLKRMIRRHEPELNSEPLYHFAQALFISTLLMLLLGVFGHNLYRYNYVWYCAFVVVAYRAYRSKLSRRTAEEREASWPSPI